MLAMRLSAGGIVGMRPSQPELKIEDIVNNKKEEGDNEGEEGINDILIAKITTKVAKKKPKMKAFAPSGYNNPELLKQEEPKFEQLKQEEPKFELLKPYEPENKIELLNIEPEEDKQKPKKNLFEVDENDLNEVEEKPVEKKQPPKKTTLKKSLKNLFEDD